MPGAPPPADPALANPASQATASPAVQEQPAAAAPEKKSKYPPKVSFYQDPADTARVRGAILHTQVAEGTRSLSDFINNAVMAEVQRLEAKYNGGQPFPAVGARGLPKAAPWDANPRQGCGRIRESPPSPRVGWRFPSAVSRPLAQVTADPRPGPFTSCQQMTVMFAACRPFGPSPMSNCARWFSSMERKPRSRWRRSAAARTGHHGPSGPGTFLSLRPRLSVPRTRLLSRIRGTLGRAGLTGGVYPLTTMASARPSPVTSAK